MEILLAALIHDIGHGAFSHALEEILKSNGIEFHHEAMTKAYIMGEGKINAILSEVDANLPQAIAAYFDKKLRSADDWKYKIVSSQMDADRLDYVQRDAMFAGMRGHGYDFERLLDLLDVHDGKSIAVNRGAIEAVEAYLVTIDQLYRAIYYHQGVRSATQMLLNIFRRAMDLYKNGKVDVFPNIGSNIHPFISLLEGGSKISLKDYGRISDVTVWGLIDYWRYYGDKVLHDLSERLLSRKLLKAITITDVTYAKMAAQEKQALQFTSEIVGDEFAQYYVAVDDPSRTSYKGYDFDLPLNFHPVAIRASAVLDTPLGAVGATGGNAKLSSCAALEPVAARVPA